MSKRKITFNENLKKKIQKTNYHGNLKNTDFNVEDIKDLIKLALKYDPKHESIILKKLFKLIPALIKLDKLVGMKNIKTEITKQIIYSLQEYYNFDKNGHMMHSVIYGNPGTGKTTVASIIADIYCSLGFLKTNNVILAKREDFIAGYTGQTATKTKALLNSARDGILVIDEVYAFGSTRDSNLYVDSFSKEAIDTLNSYLSENKDRLICIILGYKDDVDKCFFSINQGLRRRFPFSYTIQDYTPNELKDIFLYQVDNGNWYIDDSEELNGFFNDNKKYFKDNGGDTENLFFEAKLIHSKNIFGLKNPNKRILNISELESALKIILKNKNKNKDEDDKVNLMMYS
jgi:SpoVK/Ycf46/Vps4 family AAA+-type ATPase